MYFYKDSNNIFHVGEDILPAGRYILRFYSGGTSISIESSDTHRLTMDPIEIVRLQKEDNSYYSGAAELLLTTKDFFKGGYSGDVTALNGRVDTLENTIFKITYYENITGSSGTVTKPQGSTILLNTWENGIDALVSKAVGGIPNFDSGGILVNSFDTDGNFSLSGSIPSNPASLIYVIEISSLNYNLYIDRSKIINQVDVSTANAIALSAGVTTEPSYTDLGTGTINVGSCAANLYSNTTHSNKINNYTIPALSGITLVNNTINYIIVSYNSGTPVFSSTTDVSGINESDVIPVFTLYRNDNAIVRISWDALGSGLANKLHARFVKTDRIGYESGLVLTENGSRELTLSSGVTWHGAVRNPLEAVNSVTDVMAIWYPVAGVWTQNVITQYPNDQYSDGTDLQTLLPNKWTVISVYRTEANVKKIAIAIGGSYGTESEALAAPLPAVPVQMLNLGFRAAKLVLISGASTASQILSAFDGESSSYPTVSSFPTLKIGDVSGGNYTDIRADGTQRLVGDATAWKDMIMDISGRRLNSTVGKVDYDPVNNAIKFQSGGSISNLNDIVQGNQEINHEFKVGVDTLFKPHIHWFQEVVSHTPDVLDSTPYVLTLQWRLVRNSYGIDLTTPVWTTITCEMGSGGDDIFGVTNIDGKEYMGQISRFDDILIECGVSDTIQIQMARTDTETGDILVYFFDTHGKIDSFGSDFEIVKAP